MSMKVMSTLVLAAVSASQSVMTPGTPRMELWSAENWDITALLRSGSLTSLTSVLLSFFSEGDEEQQVWSGQ